MLLKIVEISENITESIVSIEAIVEDLLVIVINFGRDNRLHIPSYWRLTKLSGIPPLEIGINTDTGKLEKILFYVDKSLFDKINILSDSQINGSVIINTNIFQKTNDYVDIPEGYSISLNGSQLICLFKNANINKIQSVSYGNICIYTNTLNEIVGFAINKLQKDELEKVNSL